MPRRPNELQRLLNQQNQPSTLSRRPHNTAKTHAHMNCPANATRRTVRISVGQQPGRQLTGCLAQKCSSSAHSTHEGQSAKKTNNVARSSDFPEDAVRAMQRMLHCPTSDTHVVELAAHPTASQGLSVKTKPNQIKPHTPNASPQPDQTTSDSIHPVVAVPCRHQLTQIHDKGDGAAVANLQLAPKAPGSQEQQCLDKVQQRLQN
jgi:hypothetical protein